MLLVRQKRGTDRALRQIEHRRHRLESERRVALRHRFLADRVGENLLHAVRALARRVDRQRVAADQVAKPPQVVHADDVVGVSMREDEQVELGQVLPHALQSEFRRGVDLHVQPVHDDVEAGTRAPVARIGRRADRTIAGDHRDALRGAGAEKEDFHVPTETRAPKERKPRNSN